MLVVLNLTAPPILLIFLPLAVVGNYTLPAPAVSDVAAFTLKGEPLPSWVLNNTLYVLQGGEPAVAIYVPTFDNSTGKYKVSIRGERVVLQAPPGVMIDDVRPLPKDYKINKTGLYLYLEGDVTVVYHPFTIRPPAAPQTTTPTTPTPTVVTPTTPVVTPTAVVTPTTPTPTATPSPMPTAPVDWTLVGLVAALVVVIAVVGLWLSKKRGGGSCDDLNETDLAIIKAVRAGGGVVDRAELQARLGMAKTTLHRHLHKLARYGYIRLVQEGPRQRVELLREC
ncbi:MAG: winged helix-turn-helix domain-containing protein [Pyrobaculum sp.]